jgi:uncharacterized RDD family membrane protein YckC
VSEYGTEQINLPGWGSPFPPEQPRRDEAESTAATIDGVPTAASVAAASAIGEEVRVDYTKEDRRPFARRRRKARGIDSMILAPFAFGIVHLNGGITIAAGLLFLALELSYFFVLESIQGQTIGKKIAHLRVMRPDGSAASAGRIALRTITRPIDYTLIGILAVLASGKKRQRIGDHLAGTIVRDDGRSFRRAPDSPLIAIFPLACVGLAVAAMIGLKPSDPKLAQRSDHPYMAKIDRICEKRDRQAKALLNSGQLSWTSMRVMLRQETRKIEKLPAPPADVKADVAVVLAEHRKVDRILARASRAMDRAVNPATAAEKYAVTVPAVMQTAGERFKSLGLPYCEL